MRLLQSVCRVRLLSLSHCNRWLQKLVHLLWAPKTQKALCNDSRIKHVQLTHNEEDYETSCAAPHLSCSFLYEQAYMFCCYWANTRPIKRQQAVLLVQQRAAHSMWKWEGNHWLGKASSQGDAHYILSLIRECKKNLLKY